MGKHLRRLFSAGEVKEIFERYLSQEIGVEQALGLLNIRRRQFFKLLKVYIGRVQTSFLWITREQCLPGRLMPNQRPRPFRTKVIRSDSTITVT